MTEAADLAWAAWLGYYNRWALFYVLLSYSILFDLTHYLIPSYFIVSDTLSSSFISSYLILSYLTVHTYCNFTRVASWFLFHMDASFSCYHCLSNKLLGNSYYYFYTTWYHVTVFYFYHTRSPLLVISIYFIFTSAFTFSSSFAFSQTKKLNWTSGDLVEASKNYASSLGT